MEIDVYTVSSECAHEGGYPVVVAIFDDLFDAKSYAGCLAGWHSNLNWVEIGRDRWVSSKNGYRYEINQFKLKLTTVDV